MTQKDAGGGQRQSKARARARAHGRRWPHGGWGEGENAGLGRRHVGGVEQYSVFHGALPPSKTPQKQNTNKTKHLVSFIRFVFLQTCREDYKNIGKQKEENKITLNSSPRV